MVTSAPTVSTAPSVSPRTALILLGFVIMLWGANWPVMKVGLQFIPPLSFVSLLRE